MTVKELIELLSSERTDAEVKLRSDVVVPDTEDEDTLIASIETINTDSSGTVWINGDGRSDEDKKSIEERDRHMDSFYRNAKIAAGEEELDLSDH